MNVKTKTIGTIESFNADTQIATVRLATNGTNSTLDTNYFNQQGLVLIDVPVEFPRCGEFVMTFPVKKGDDCIVEFYETGIDHWLYHNRRAYQVVDGRPEPAARRRFSRKDASCRVSMDNLANKISGFNSEGLEIRHRNGNQKMIFHPDGVIEVISPADIKFKAARNITMDAGESIEMNGKNINSIATASNKVAGQSVTLKAQSISMEQ